MNKCMFIRWRRDRQIIRESGLFDIDYYLRNNPDVAAAGCDPVTHFVKYGWHERRMPSPNFDVAFYLHANPDVAQSGINPLVHFILHGQAEGRMPCPKDTPELQDTSSYSCDQQERGVLQFYDGWILPCCVYSGSNDPAHKLGRYENGDFSVQILLEKLDALYAANNGEKKEKPCGKCLLLQNRRWPIRRTAPRFDIVVLNHHTVCNLNCHYCFQPRQTDKPTLVLPALKKLYSAGVVNSDTCLSLAGGEPTLLSELDDILRFGREQGSYFEFWTNAVCFSSSVFDILISDERNILRISLDSGTAETYLEVKGKDYFDKVCANIRHYAQIRNSNGKSKICLKYIMTEKNNRNKDYIGFAQLAGEINPAEIWLDIEHSLAADTEQYQRYFEDVLTLEKELANRSLSAVRWCYPKAR